MAPAPDSEMALKFTKVVRNLSFPFFLGHPLYWAGVLDQLTQGFLQAILRSDNQNKMGIFCKTPWANK